MGIFKTGDVTIKDGIFLIVTEGGERCAFKLDKDLESKLYWFVKSPYAASLSWDGDDVSLFIGPYIRGSETGAIVQVIHLYTREVYNATVDFSEHTLEELKHLLV